MNTHKQWAAMKEETHSRADESGSVALALEAVSGTLGTELARVALSEVPFRAKVLIGVHSLCAGGTERVVSTLLRSFQEKGGLEVHCVLYGRKPTCFYPVPDGVTVHRPAFEFDAYPRIVSTVKTVAHIRGVVSRVKPDAFLNFGERWNNLALLSVRGLPYKIFVADRSNPAKGLGFVHDQLRRSLYARASGVIVQTREAAKRMERILPAGRPVNIIHNPLFTVAESNSTQRRREILFVGRLIPSKHVDRLIRIFAQARVPGWHLTVVGGDAQGYSELEKLRALVQALDLEEWVYLEGTQADVVRYYRRAAIFAFSSSSEGFPNALAEALAFGLPSVAYDCSAGPADLIIDGKNGYLVPLFDDERFARRLRGLMTNDHARARMSVLAAESVVHLDPSRIAREVLDACGLGGSED